jgi:hypothetical protein
VGLADAATPFNDRQAPINSTSRRSFDGARHILICCMPIDLTKIPPFLIQAATDGRLVLLVGAGISKQANSKVSDILPNWPELIREIRFIALNEGSIDADDEARIERLILDGKYLIAAQTLRERIDPNLFETFLRKRFLLDIKPGRIHRLFFKLRTSLIMTTNYDALLEKANLQVFGRDVRVATPRDLDDVFRILKAPWAHDLPVIFKLHGTVFERESMVLGERDYYRLIYRQPHYRLALHTIFMTRAVLMMGFSFSDPDITDVIGEGMGGGGDFIVLPKGEKDRIEIQRLRKTFGVEVIEYEPSDGHAELAQLIESLAGAVPSRSKKRASR